jgi:hypothetical protein
MRRYCTPKKERNLWQMEYERQKRAKTLIQKIAFEMYPKQRCSINYKTLAHTFVYFAQKKGLRCVFPYIFNGQKVKGFDKNGRPLGINDIDLIQDFYDSLENGFQITKNIDKAHRK